MKKIKNNFTEKLIINKYFKTLSLNKKGTFNFENDAAYLNIPHKNYKFAVTTDTILENIDFFKNDNPKSIAQKITTVNLSDLYAMGAMPHSYLLNLCLPSYITNDWLKSFCNYLKKLQLKYNFYLLGGDLSKSDNLIISSTFFGYINKNINVYQNKVNLDDDIWVSGYIGESKIGLEIIRKNITIDKNLREYFINKYLYPKPCKLGPNLALYSSSIVDVSDGFIGDLKKMLNDKYGALISLNKIPLSIKAKKLIFALKKIKLEHVLNSGDDYSLIIVSNKKYRKKIKNIANKNKVKISRVGKVVLEKGVQFDSYINNNIIKEYDHFS